MSTRLRVLRTCALEAPGIRTTILGMTYGKKDLPYPYSQDFSGIVTRVKGVRESTRAALVNSLKVASYLKAGENLVTRHLGAPKSIAGGDGCKAYWSGLHFLSERALSREVAELDPP